MFLFSVLALIDEPLWVCNQQNSQPVCPAREEWGYVFDVAALFKGGLFDWFTAFDCCCWVTNFPAGLTRVGGVDTWAFSPCSTTWALGSAMLSKGWGLWSVCVCALSGKVSHGEAIAIDFVGKFIRQCWLQCTNASSKRSAFEQYFWLIFSFNMIF